MRRTVIRNEMRKETKEEGAQMDAEVTCRIEVSPKRVWQALTDGRELGRWCCESATVTKDGCVWRSARPFGRDVGGAVILWRDGEAFSFVWEMGHAQTTVAIEAVSTIEEGMPPGNFTQVTIRHCDVPEDWVQGTPYVQSDLTVLWNVWLRQLRFWLERAETLPVFQFDPAHPSDMLVRAILIDREPNGVWPYIVDETLRHSWFPEPMGPELGRVEGVSATYEWIQDAPGDVTFALEAVAGGRTLVFVRHRAWPAHLSFDYQIGWHDYLCALAERAARPVIRQSVWIAAPPDCVWPFLTSQEGMRQWYSEEAEFEPHVGGRVVASDYGVQLVGYVTEMERERKLAFTFAEEDTVGKQPPFLITLELWPENGGTRVFLTQAGFDALSPESQQRIFDGYRRGWSDAQELPRLAAAVMRSANLSNG